MNLAYFGGDVENRDRPVAWLETNPTFEQDRLVWKQELKD